MYNICSFVSVYICLHECAIFDCRLISMAGPLECGGQLLMPFVGSNLSSSTFYDNAKAVKGIVMQIYRLYLLQIGCAREYACALGFAFTLETWSITATITIVFLRLEGRLRILFVTEKSSTNE